MSVRVCYLVRADRGSSLRGMRLVGQASDAVWEQGAAGPEAYDAAASWIKQQIIGTRSTGVAMLCLDVEGGVCSWLTSPSANPAVVAMIARQGGSGEAKGSALEFYAPDGFSSSVQPLDARDGNGTALAMRKRSERRGVQQESQRLAVLAVEDVPARLLMDALDRDGVPVESVASLWHVMSAAWDPGAPRPGSHDSGAVVAESAAPTAVMLVDPQSSRLLWAWSRAGRLMVAGSMRLRAGALPEPDAIVEQDAVAAPSVMYGAAEVSRLATEWLSWAVQVGQAPSRFVCVLPDAEQAGEFGRAMGKAWAGATVDVVTNEDPVGATLHRMANQLENTPLKEEPDPRAGLVELSRRPGRQHRRMYKWWSGAVAAGAVVMAVLGWTLGRSATSAQAAAKAWDAQGKDAIKQVYPDALLPRPGISPYMAFKTELEKAEKNAKPVERGDQAMPVLEELETISMVLGNAGYSVESVDLDSKGLPRVTTTTAKLSDAEDLLEALKRISGSHVVDWNFTPSSRTEGDKTVVRATYTGRWAASAKGGR